MRRTGLVLTAFLPLALVACETGHDESVLGYLMTGVFVAVIGLAVGFVVLGVLALGFFAGATALVLNLVRPTRGSRVAGVVVGGVDVALGLAGLGCVVWLAAGGHHGATLRVELDGLRGALPVVALIGMGVANAVMAVAPARRVTTTAAPSRPGS